MADITKTIKSGNKSIDYISIDYHRGKKDGKKSKWSITIDEEISCFEKSFTADWSSDDNWFGIHLSDKEKVLKLGENIFSEDLFIAKFISNKKKKKVHGYPGDYIRKSQDIPALAILKEWKDNDWISKSKMSKISRGMPCNL